MNLVTKIADRKLDEARHIINEKLMKLSAIKLEESKKKIASDAYGALPFMKSRNQIKVAKDVLESHDAIGRLKDMTPKDRRDNKFSRRRNQDHYR